MSYAWRQLQSAIRVLAVSGERRVRLQAALGKLAKLKPRDLPSEVSEEFIILFDGISRFPAKNIAHEIRAAVDVLSDAQVMEAIGRIMRMYDVVASYQPRPVIHPGGPGRRAASPHAWPIPALHILETRHGAFFHETA